MIFTVAEQISDLSHKCSLYPGDVILTGTPAGVGAGRNEFLKAGDRIDVRIQSIGELHTRVV
jgi:2-keto-4-pentenoate hydratase/2-oxohepta-3-ene-1,7-dioic acid hydratase in catechol pathway